MATDIKLKIREQAKAIGIDKIGFGTAEPFSHLEASLEEQKALGHTSGFEHPVIKERIYPELTFKNPKSFISIALAYPSMMKEVPKREKDVRRGEFARASWGVDYHDILRDKLNQLAEWMSEEFGDEYRFESMVDTGPFIDVAVAHRCGIGFIGKNGLLITKEFGSYVYLGELITNLELEPDDIVPNGCGDCVRCIQSCPTGALLGDGRMNAKKCLSYQTQVRNYMAKKYRRKMGHVIYGCDICQMTCPYNRGVDFHRHSAMEPVAAEVMPELKPLLTMSNREFKEKFGHLAGSWRGKKPLQRNAIIALANYRDRTAIPLLLELIEKDPRPMIRGISAWAVAQIMQRQPHCELVEFLEEAQRHETEAETITEFEEAIELLKENM